jgi:hypothetical protein
MKILGSICKNMFLLCWVDTLIFRPMQSLGNRIVSRNHYCACQNQNTCGNYTLCVEITLERVVITLVSVIFTPIRVEITLG